MPSEPGNPKRRDEATESPEGTEASAKSSSLWRRLLTGKWLAIIVGVSIAIHGVGFLCYQGSRKARPEAPAAEVSLGVFQFADQKVEDGRIAAAEFSLYVTLLEHADRAARDLLTSRRFRVQQDVEQLLRQAHSRDFEDPALGELKRQLREQINESLGIRGISDVIVTNLKFGYGKPGTPPSAETAPRVSQ
jgi:flagellar basal body-associated protein FliL